MVIIMVNMNWNIKDYFSEMWDLIISGMCMALCELFPKRTRTIPCPENPSKPLLTQFVIIPERLYLQHFHNPNSDEFHNHRWEKMRSWILTSSYIEQRIDGKSKEHKRFTTYKMTHETKHRVVKWNEYCWTLFYMGKVVNPNWGYFNKTKNTFIPWHEFIADEDKIEHIETGKITSY